MAEPLRCQKHLFSLEPGHTWLNSAYMGPLPEPVVEAGMKALRKRAFPVDIVAGDFFAPADRVRELAGDLVGASAETVAIVPTASYGLALVAKNLAPQSGANVVLLGDQFPSNVYAWRPLKEAGVEMRVVTAPPGPFRAAPGQASRAARWNEALLAAIDRDTMLVAIEQAHWTEGTLFDLERVGARAAEVGAAFVVDATQTAGAMPIDVRSMRIDALVVHAYKAMLSGYGLGFVALSDRFAGGRPIEESWLTREGSEDFARLVDYQDAYAPGMRRYDSSLRSSGVLVDMLEASCRLLASWQPARVRAYLLGITRDFAAAVRAAGFDVADEHERAANLFGVGLPQGMAPESVRAALAAEKIHVSVRGAAVRVAPHVYNDEADLARLRDALLALS